MLRADILKYKDADNLVVPNSEGCSPTDHNVSGNGVLYTGELMLLLKREGELNDYERSQYLIAMMGCMPHKLGLLSRSPSHPDQEGQDDYVGLAAGCWAANISDLPQRVLDYGKSHFWFLNNENPGSLKHKDGRWNWSAVFLRYPAMIGAMHYAARFTPPLLYKIAMAISIALSGWKKPLSDCDSRKLGWLLMSVVDNKSWIIRQASKIFTKRLFKDYPNGMQDVVKFAYKEPHPFRTYYPTI